MTTRSGTTLLLVFILPASFLLSSAFSDESLKDLSRLPHFQRIWLQRLDQNNRRNNNNFNSANVTITSRATTTSTATWTDASTTDESLEEEGDERVTTMGPVRNADGAMESTTIGGKVTLTISEAKERLKARRMKNRKVKPTNKEEEQHFAYTKKTDTIFRDEKEDAVEVKKHIQRMTNAGCSTPAVRLVYVRQQHEASPNVRYLPACTWLHRCSDEVGCCTDDSKTCSASHIESVSLPFFVLTMTGSETKRTVTRLSFENHTACECVGRNSDLMPRTEPYDPAEDEQERRLSLLYYHDENNNNSDDGKSSRHHENINKKSKTTKKGQRHDDASLQLGRVATAYSPDASLLLRRNEQEEEHPTAKRQFRIISHSNPKNYSNSTDVSKCRCPSGFTPIVSQRKSSSCGLCQCPDYKEPGRSRHHHRERSSMARHHQLHRCGRLKRGLETFSQRDIGCINDKKCGTPECDYGHYTAGRCPRRNEWRPRS